MAGRLVLALIGVALLARPAYALSRSELREYSRLRVQCEEQGLGKSCYRYGIARWTRKGFVDKTIARRYLMRGCDLKYKESCRAYDEASTRAVVQKRRLAGSATMRCFEGNDIQRVQLTPNPSGIKGQLVQGFSIDSFWARVGFHEGDILIKINNIQVNSPREIDHAFTSSGRQLGIEIERNNQFMTLWYNCVGSAS